MLRRIRILKAYFLCHYYLLRTGMWRGESMVEGYEAGRLRLIAAQNCGKYTKIFYDDGWTALGEEDRQWNAEEPTELYHRLRSATHEKREELHREISKLFKDNPPYTEEQLRKAAKKK